MCCWKVQYFSIYNNNKNDNNNNNNNVYDLSTFVY